MTFSTMWPLVFLVAVPIIIIIYMLRPKGKKMVVPSLMLWKNAEVNSSSMSFVKKLLRNILMILERLALYRESILQHRHRVAQREGVALDGRRIMCPKRPDRLEQLRSP